MPDIYEGNNRRITSTSQAAKGSILFGNSSYNEAEDVLDIAGTLQTEAFSMETGAGDGKVLTSDSEGNASWGDGTPGPQGDPGPPGPAGAPGAVLQTTVALNAADIIGMNASPVELVAAPGEGKALVFLGLVANVTRTETGFTGGGAVSAKYAGGSDVMSSLAATVVTGAAGQSISYRTPADLSDLAVADVENKALVLTNADVPFAGGTGSAEITVFYATVDV
jgi:hypothetical protein